MNVRLGMYFKTYQAVKKKQKVVNDVNYDITVYQHMNCNWEDDIGEVVS